MIRTSVGIVLGLACLIAAGCEKKAPAPAGVRPIRVMRIEAERSLIGPKFPGRAKATQETNAAFRVSGTIIEIPVKIGDEVKKDQVIAKLDPRDFEVQVTSAQAALAAAKADLALAEDKNQRVTKAYAQGGVSEFEVTSAKEAMNAAAATVDARQAALESAQDEVSYTILRAPYDGTVTERFAEQYEEVKSSDPVLRVLDHSRIEFLLAVPEHMMARAVGDVNKIQCRFDAYPNIILDATIKEVGKEADPTTRTYPVTLIMDQPEGAQVLPGMTGRAWTIGRPPEGEDQGWRVVPLSGVGEDAAGKKFVWVLDEAAGTVSRRDVETSTISPNGVLVKGLRDGEMIATAGISFLTEGQKVRPMDLGAGER